MIFGATLFSRLPGTGYMDGCPGFYLTGAAEIAEFKKRTIGIIAAKDWSTDGKSRGLSAMEAGSVLQTMKCLHLRYSMAG